MTVSSPGQKRGTCGHVMVSFDGHSKCARCRDKGVGEHDCVLKKDLLFAKGLPLSKCYNWLHQPTENARIKRRKCAG